MSEARDYSTDPSPRILAAEQRREFRRLLDASSLGTPGAKACRKYARGEPLTVGEAEAMAEEMRELEQVLTSPRRRA